MKRAFPTFLLGIFVFFCLSLSHAQESQAQGNNIDTLRQIALNEQSNIDAWINLGNAYLDTNNFDLAAESFYEAVALDYKSGEAHFGLGLAEYSRSDFPSALFEFSEVARLYPDRFDGHYNRAVTLAKLLQPEESIQAFMRAVAEAAPEASDERVMDAYVGLAGQYRRVENYAAAAEAYSNALSLDEGNRDIVFQRADSLYRAGQGLEALADLSELETLSSDYKVSILIADIYAQQDQTEYALRSLERALRNVGADAKAQGNILLRLGTLHNQLERPSEATSSFQRAIAADANLWQAHYQLGLSYLDAEQVQTAIPYFEQARAINPDANEVALILASSYEQAGQFAQAAQMGSEALSRLDEETDMALIANMQALVGRAKYSIGDYPAALEMLVAASEANPQDAMSFVWAGLAAFNLQDFPLAVSSFEQAVQLDSSNVEAQANLAAAYFQEQRFQDAAFVYELILNENPQDAEALYHLGLSLYAQSFFDDAKTAWEDSAALGYPLAQTALQQYF